MKVSIHEIWFRKFIECNTSIAIEIQFLLFRILFEYQFIFKILFSYFLFGEILEKFDRLKKIIKQA